MLDFQAFCQNVMLVAALQRLLVLDMCFLDTTEWSITILEIYCEVGCMMPQAEGVLKPNLATHLACGHLTGIAKEEKELVLVLNKECYEVCLPTFRHIHMCMNK